MTRVIGAANDVANSFGTSVGARVLSLRAALVTAGIFNAAGALLLGSSVTNTIKGGVVDPAMFEATPGLYMLGMLCSLFGSGAWLLLATLLKLPVSATHSIVGAIVGFALVQGSDTVEWWPGVGRIALSWVLSPVLSGLCSTALFVLTRTLVLRSPPELARSRLRWVLAIIVAVTLGLLAVFVALKLFPKAAADSMWLAIIVALAVLLMGVSFGGTYLWLAPYLMSERGQSWVPATPALSSPSRQKDEYSEIPDAAGRELVPLLESTAKVQSLTFIHSFIRSSNVEAHSLVLVQPLDNALDNDGKAFIPLSSEAYELHLVAEEFDVDIERSFAGVQVLTAAFLSFAWGANGTTAQQRRGRQAIRLANACTKCVPLARCGQ